MLDRIFHAMLAQGLVHIEDPLGYSSITRPFTGICDGGSMIRSALRGNLGFDELRK